MPSFTHEEHRIIFDCVSKAANKSKGFIAASNITGRSQSSISAYYYYELTKKDTNRTIVLTSSEYSENESLKLTTIKHIASSLSRQEKLDFIKHLVSI